MKVCIVLCVVFVFWFIFVLCSVGGAGKVLEYKRARRQITYDHDFERYVFSHVFLHNLVCCSGKAQAGDDDESDYEEGLCCFVCSRFDLCRCVL